MARKRTADKQHRWLSQVEVTGVVFSEPVLADAAPSGFPNLDKAVLARFHKAREIWNLPKGMLREDGQAAWVRFVLEEILRLRSPKDWLVGSAIPSELVVRLPAQQETLRPDRALVDEGAAVLLFLEVPRSQSLDRPWVQHTGRWKASPTTKLERLLRDTRVELGLVTNGEAWRLVVASPSETASWITWTASSWAESPVTLAAFRDLLGEERFFAGARDKVALELIRQSRERQLDVADQLGEQARHALALVVHELDRVDSECGGAYLDTYTEREVFESIVAFIMRLLFLLFAEENSLLPHGSVAYDRSYGVLHLLTELEGQHRLSPEKLKRSYSAFARLLATSRLIHDGSVDPDIRIAAHGGRLFDSERYPLLEGRRRDGSWAWEPGAPPRVSDAVVREVLRSLKYANADGSKQLVSYRTLAVEQIGHLYEGLLDRRVFRNSADQTLFFLAGSAKNRNPDPIPREALFGLSKEGIWKLIAIRSGRTLASVTKEATRSAIEGHQTDPEALVAPFLRPMGRVRPGGLTVVPSRDRRVKGAHYTPPTLTEPLVRLALQHLAPLFDASPTEDRRDLSPRDVLAIRICDPAMGSGAFLVQTVRLLAGYLVQAWEQEEALRPDETLTMPICDSTKGSESELLLPASREEKQVWARRFVAEHCIFGVDVNPQAVEMAKLSLWIATASKDRAFTFLDHALRHGDSLVGLNRQQIARLTWDREVEGPPLLPGFVGRDAKMAQARDLVRLAAVEPYLARESLQIRADRSATAERECGDAILMCFFGASTEAERRPRLWQLRRNAHRSFQAPVEGATLDERQTFHWDVEFPEVFHGGGFDVIVGNPPWGADLDAAEKDWLDQSFELVGDYESAMAFVEQALRLLRVGGTLGLVVPNTMLLNDSASSLRQALREQHTINVVVDLTEHEVFRGAAVRSAALVLNRGRVDGTSPETFEYARSLRDADGRLQQLSYKLLQGPHWANLHVPRPDSMAFTTTVEDLFDVKQGYIPYRKSTLQKRYGDEEGARIVKERAWHSSEPIDQSSMRELQGRDVSRARVRWSGSWVQYGPWVSTYLDPSWFQGRRVLVREIVGAKPRLVIASRCEETFVHNPSIIVCRPKSDVDGLCALLELFLNSTLATLYVLSISAKAAKGMFPKVLVKDLRALPFPPMANLPPSILAEADRLARNVDYDATDSLDAVDRFVERVFHAEKATNLREGG